MNLFPEQKPNATVPAGDFTELDFGAYSEPSGGYNQLGSIGYSTEQFFSKWGKPNTAQRKLWFHVSKNWLELAHTHLEVRNDSTLFLLLSSVFFLFFLNRRFISIGLPYDHGSKSQSRLRSRCKSFHIGLGILVRVSTKRKF